MIFVFNSLNFRYFNENFSGEKIKEPNSGGMEEEENPAGRERREERRIAVQVHDSFNSKIQCQIK